MKKRLLKVAGIFLAAGLSMSMFTACDLLSSDDLAKDTVVEGNIPERSAKNKKEEKIMTTQEAADILTSSDELKKITVNGLNVKILADVKGCIGGQDLNLSYEVGADIRTKPQLFRIRINGYSKGTKNDVDIFMFKESDGKYYYVFNMYDGTYGKTTMPDENVQQFKTLMSESQTTVFKENGLAEIAKVIKFAQAIGKKKVEGKEYDAFSVTVSEEQINSLIDNYLPYVIEGAKQNNAVTKGQIEDMLAKIPDGYKAIPIEFYFDNGVPAGIKFDFTNVVIAHSEKNTASNSNCVVTMLFNYGDTSEIEIPDAILVDNYGNILG